MLPGPTLSPMLILLLLLYGLLLAFSFVLWNLLSLHGRDRERSDRPQNQPDGSKTARPQPQEQSPAVRERPPTPARPNPPATVRPEPTVTVTARQAVPVRQAAETPAQKPWLRAPAVPEQTAVPKQAAPQLEPAPRKQGSVRAEPEHPAAARPAQTAVQPAAAVKQERSAAASRKRNEDAFERFLRSSRNDPDSD